MRRLLLVPLLTGFGGRLRCLRTQVDKFEEVIIMWNVQGRLAMALPLECRSCVQFEFKKRGNEWTTGIMPKGLQSMQMLLHSIVQASQLLSRAFLERTREVDGSA